MQEIFDDGEDEFFMMNSQNTLNISVGDLFFSDIIPSEEIITGSPGSSDSQDSPPSYLSIPSIQPNIHIKQEINSPQDQQITNNDNDNNKRKRNVKNEKIEKEKGVKTPAKKIRKKHPEMLTAVTLSREKLLTTSTEEFTKWVDEIKSQRDLTQEEVADIRRQKRLIRNRESAQASRDRKKNEFQLLEKQIKQLREEKEMAMREISEMRNKINILENENLYMKTTIQHNPVLNEMYSGIGNIQSKNNNNSFINTKTVKNAGVCLFLLIFSFGLFFNVQNSMNQSQPKVYIPQNIPTTALPHSTLSNPNNLGLRNLGTNARRLLSKTKTQISTLDSNHVPPQVTLSQSVHNVPENQVLPVLVKSVELCPNETVVEQQKIDQRSLQPNVHLYCMNAKEYLMNNSESNKDLILSLNIPKSSLSKNSPILNFVNSPNDDLIEVKCRVIENKI